MPKLPDVSQVGNVSSQGLRLPALSAPRVPDNGLEDLGRVISVVNEKFADADDTAKANQALFESTARLQDKDAEVRTSGDFANAVPTFEKSFNEILEGQKGKLSSGAFAKFSGAFGRRFLSSRASLSVFARTKQVEAVNASTENVLGQLLDAAGKPENVENPILFGQTILGPAKDALDGAVNVGAQGADDAAKRFAKFQQEVRERAISGFIERQPTYLKAFKALESGSTGNENLDSLLAEMSPEERLKTKRSALKALNERKTLDRSLKEEREGQLEAIAGDLEVQFYTTEDPIQRGQILGQLEALARTTDGLTSSGADLKTLQDFHVAAGLEGGARDDPDIVRRLNAGLLSGELTAQDVLRSSTFLTQSTTARLMSVANTQRNQRQETGARIIRNSFGILKDTVISDRAQATVAQAAGDALVLYDQILADPKNTEDPVALATRLAKQGEESIRQVKIRNAQSALETRLSQHGISIKGFDLTNRKAFEEQLKEALAKADLSQTERARLGVLMSGQINTIFEGK